MVTVAMKRANPGSNEDSILDFLDSETVKILPNTSGVRDSKEAIFVAEMAREALQTNWLKLEIHPDPKYLMPDPIATLEATKELAQAGFIVLPYCHADPVLCKKLEEAIRGSKAENFCVL
jgi:thiazole synthase